MKLFSLLFLSLLTIQSYGQKLIQAVEAKDYAAVEKLLKKGEKVNSPAKDGQFPLWNAVWNYDIKMVELLLKNGADARQKFIGEQSQSSCLEIASQEGLTEISKLLVEAGADPNERGQAGHTPIRVAARNGRTDLVKYFASLNCDINTKGDDGATPLEHAASKGHLEIVQFLVEKGAEINVQDNDGDYALGEAVKAGHKDIVEFLLARGADGTLKNKDGRNSIDLAKLAGQPKIEAMLRKAQAK